MNKKTDDIDFYTEREKHRKEILKYDQQNDSSIGTTLRQVVLGGQDGLVNVLGILLGVAVATNDSKIVIIAGMAATFAESLSMAAVAYTSTRATQDFYHAQLKREKEEIEEIPHMEVQEIREIYEKKGFRGRLLEDIVKHITSDKVLWLREMMREELNLTESETVNPVKEAAVVGISAFAGSFIPLIPFFFLSAQSALVVSLLVSLAVLFGAGIIKARLTTGSQLKSGIEMLLIGGIAAIAGYAIGAIFKVSAG
ncbi:MAG: VIT1/CCC1 transporter family protein [Candidatus Micrarchaeia archaeon]